MEENFKSRVILILAVIIAILVVSNISSCSNMIKQRSVRDKEMATRMDLEEKIGAINQEKSLMDAKAAALSQELEEEKAAHQATKKALLQEQMVNESLKEEIQKVTKLKEALEEDLKEALVSGKQAPKSKQ